MINSEEWAPKILDLSEDPSFQSDISEIRAKALLKEVFGKLPAYKWKYIPTTVIRNITAATFGLQNLSLESVASLAMLKKAAHQIALTWESLAKLKEKTKENTALMNAAICYELAGYQANAACLAKEVDRELYEIDTPKIFDLASKFVQRRFLQLICLSERLMKEPKIVGSFQDGILEAIAIATAGKGFTDASLFLLNGKERALGQAKQYLSEAEKALALLGMREEANLVRGVSSLLPVITENSIWNVLASIVEDNPKWKRYLKLLARGPGKNIFNTASICELWPSQLYALEKGLLDLNSSKIIKMPTSSGKTRIAELSIVHTLVTEPGSKCVYIAPYRALVYELEQAFLHLFGDLGFNVSSIIGTYETDDFADLLTKDADILVLTPERLDLLQRAQPEFLDNVRLFVMDEGQIVQDQQRGAKFELLLTRLKRRLPKARFLFLSAVVPHETLEDFAKWFNVNPEGNVITTDWRPSIQRVAKFEWEDTRGVIKYSPEEDIPLLHEFVPGIIKQNIYRFENEITGRMNTKRFPEKTKAHTAAELAYRFAELGPVLVFCSQSNYAVAVAKALETRLDLARKTNRDVPIYFLNGSSTHSYACASEWLGTDHLVTGFFKKGIAIHYGRLPSILKQSIEKDFRNRKFRILIATNTLAQGVNLPIKTVVVHGCRRYSGKNRFERIPAMDYWNIAGRAGRAGRETEGTIIHIIMTNLDNQDYYYYLMRRRNVEPLRSALFKMLQDLVHERVDEEVIRDNLDAETLALLVEEKTDALSEERMRSILKDTLVQQQAIREDLPIEKILKVFQNSAEEIKKRIPDTSYWPVFSSTGLRSNSCEILRKYVQMNKEKIENLLVNSSSRDLTYFIEVVLEACGSIPEMQSKRSFGGSYNELLERWLSGTNINYIVNEFGVQSPSFEELAKLIEDYFTYLLPWGISALIRIAVKELELEKEQLSDFTVFFPSMVKFGVPIPVATWAFSLGIPFRKNAIDIATKYLVQTDNPTFEDFREWVGKLNHEELKEEFGFEGVILEGISRALSMSSSNRLLRTYSSCEEILPYETDIKGIAYDNRTIVASQARVDQSVDLIRDYDNTLDHNAIKVQLFGKDLGYLERYLAQLLAPDIDCGLKLKGKITTINRLRVPKIRIQITLQNSD